MEEVTVLSLQSPQVTYINRYWLYFHIFTNILFVSYVEVNKIIGIKTENR